MGLHTKFDLILYTKTLEEYAQFASDLFDTPAKKIANEDAFEILLPFCRLVVKSCLGDDGDKVLSSPLTALQIYFDDIDDFISFKAKVEFFYYRYQKDISITVTEHHDYDQSFQFTDPDGRIWRAALSLLDPQQTDFRDVSNNYEYSQQ